jgi:RNA polymerase sigma-70 factor (ECF subfamily)
VNRCCFQRWYEQSAPALRSYLRYTCRDTALADDLLQETYLRLLRTELPELDDAQRKRYLYRTAHSALADHFRRSKREQERIDEAAESKVDWGAASATMAAINLPLDLRRVLEKLKPREQQLLWLAYVEGFSHRETAAIIGVQENSVRVLLLRARERIATLLTAQGLGPAEDA